MAKLVRARVKSLEQLPEWAKCCHGAIAAISEMLVDITVDLSQQTLTKNPHCVLCGTLFDSGDFGISVLISAGRQAGHYVPLPLLDLDEGSSEVPRRERGAEELEEIVGL